VNATTPPIRLTIAVIAQRLPILHQILFGRSGSIDKLDYGAHTVGANICLDDLPGGVEALVLTGIDRAFQLGKLDIDLRFEVWPPALLLGIVGSQLLQF